MKIFFSRIKEFLKEFWVNNFNILIYIFLFGIFSYMIIRFSSMKGYFSDASFIKEITVESFGMLFDILVLGILFTILYKFGERRRDIKRYLETIDDYRDWNENEASFRILGAVKRLNLLGVTKINLHNCFLKGAQFTKFDPVLLKSKKLNLEKSNFNFAYLSDAFIGAINLRGACFLGTDLDRTDLRGANLEDAHLVGSHLNNAKLSSANLKNACLHSARLVGAQLQDATLNGANLDMVNLKRANLKRASLNNTTHLSIAQLLVVKTLYKTTGLDTNIKRELRKKKPRG